MNLADNLFQCRQIFQCAMTTLGFSLTEEKICEISQLIIDGMGGKWRSFHTFEHILMLSKTNEPLITLAGLFHDLIYLQVDENIPFNLTSYVNPFILEKEGSFFIKSNIDYQDKCFSIVLQIFDFNLGDKLIAPKGQNEFLSALIASQILQPYLPLSLITRIVTIIELTIPFRKSKDKNKTIPQQLQNRLEIVNKNFNLGLTQEEITLTITQAVKLANLDVSGFASDDVKNFVKNTWLLLPETNHCLYDTQKYSIQDYRFALVNTTKFINFISPDLVFHRYHNEPNIDTFQELITRCENNLHIVRIYLKIKLVSIAILEALSSRFFPPMTLSFFWNPHPDNTFFYASIFDFLPSISGYQPQNNQEKIILDLFSCKSSSNLFPDVNHSLFCLFIINHLSLQGFEQYSSQCYHFFNGQLTPEKFLSVFPPSLISMVSDSIVQLLQQKQGLIITI